MKTYRTYMTRERESEFISRARIMYAVEFRDFSIILYPYFAHMYSWCLQAKITGVCADFPTIIKAGIGASKVICLTCSVIKLKRDFSRFLTLTILRLAFF